MNCIYIAEENDHDQISSLQDEIKELEWSLLKVNIPLSSLSARRQWVKVAEQLFKEQCRGGWIAVAYLIDGVLYAHFEHSSSATAFAVVSKDF